WHLSPGLHYEAPAWTEQEVLDLITVWGDESDMKDRGYNRDPQQCRTKLKELRHAYQRTREANGRSTSEPQTCRFYDELHAILGGAPTTTQPCAWTLSMDSHATGMQILGTRKIAHSMFWFCIYCRIMRVVFTVLITAVAI
uniref:Myb/SANT-like DNA-binding domain-containing protein n=1 Tax=Chrysemys picta bellii TaxID=8478 RepID=A0A8C3J017_CHRPI